MKMRIDRLLALIGGFILIGGLTIAQEPPPAKSQEESTGAAKKAQDPAEQDPRVGVDNPQRKDVFDLAPKVRGAELRARAEAAYEKGWKFVLSCQNKDGTWGSALPVLPKLKNFGFGTTSPGSNHGVRHACTAIIALALLRKEDRTPAEQKAFERATEPLLSTEHFAYDRGEAFNTWGYGYKLTYLVELLNSPEGKKVEERARAAAQVCIEGLKRFQLVDGGWNYYANPALGGTSMSFNTANFLLALHRARETGLDVADGLIEDPIKILLKMRTARGGFVYDARFMADAGSVNELSTAARTAAISEALAEVGKMGPAELERSLEIFDEGENWLEDGRKLINPHTAVHQVSGYFFFYGYYYLSELLPRLGKKVPLDRWERNAWTMVRTQEKNGSWWDTAAAGYGDKWGTGFALLVLQRYLDVVPAGAKPTAAGG